MIYNFNCYNASAGNKLKFLLFIIILALSGIVAAGEIQVKRDSGGYVWIRSVDEQWCARWQAVHAVGQFFPDQWEDIFIAKDSVGWNTTYIYHDVCADYIVTYNWQSNPLDNTRPLYSLVGFKDGVREVIGRVAWKTPCGALVLENKSTRWHQVSDGVAVCEVDR